MMSTHVDILLATYNNESYVDELLASLLKQTYADWRILARDDGSSDATVERLQAFADANPGRMTIVQDESGNLGPCRNFCNLLERSDAEYAMFCDADDVWLPNKIARTLEETQRIETERGKDCPVLVHADLRVVDERLGTIAESFWRLQNLRPAMCRFHRVLTNNSITGCATMVNAALRRLGTPVPRGAAMHDHWLGLIAATFGRIGTVPEPLILYRQHGENSVGASGWGLRTIAGRVRAGFVPLRGSLRRLADQARAFGEQYGDRLDEQQTRTARALADLPDQTFLRRRYTALRYGLRKSGLLRNIAFFVSL